MPVWAWVGFIVFVLVMLALDLGVLNRRAHIIRAKEALTWSAFCAALALAFSVVVYFLYHARHGPMVARESAMLFLAGWVVEQSLSLDNIFVIALIFQYFRVPMQFQHRALFWGIIGALLMRGVMIAAGAALLHRFEWMIYIFGALLIFTAIKMLRAAEEEIHPDRNLFVRIARRFFPVESTFDGQRFFTRRTGRLAMTPMFLVLLVIESTDVLFAVDSIPAIFALTRDPFIVFTSNIFAILNLRSLYFALADLLDRFRYLKYSLVVILAYVGVKMLLSHTVKIPVLFSLGLIAMSLCIGVLASWGRNEPRRTGIAAESAEEPTESPPAPGSANRCDSSAP